MPEKLRNIGKILTQANNGQETLIYTPGMIGGYQTDAVIYDFFATFKIQSITELPYIPKPVGSVMMTVEELDADFEERTQSSPSKILSIDFEVDGLTVNGTEILVYRRSPSYKENLLELLTTQSKLGIQYGAKIKASVKDFGSGLLGANDSISFWLVLEESKILDFSEISSVYGNL